MRHASLFARPSCRSAFALLACLTILSCTSAPELQEPEGGWDDSAEWPAFLPTQTLRAMTQQQNIASSLAETTSSTQALAERAAGLRSRARALAARPVLSPSERARLLAAIRRNN